MIWGAAIIVYLLLLYFVVGMMKLYDLMKSEARLRTSIELSDRALQMHKDMESSYHCPDCGPPWKWLYDAPEKKCYHCGKGIC